MKFYRILPLLDLKEIGDYPQIQDFKTGFDSRRPESCSRISRYDSEVPPLDIDFDGMQLTKKTKLTDFVSASYMSKLTGLLVSESLLSYITSKRIVETLIFPVGLYYKDEKLSAKYFWIHYSKAYPEIIDYKQSKFFLNHSEVKYKDVTISSYQDYLKKQEASQYTIDSKYLVLMKEYLKDFDIFRIGIIKSETYITEEIKEEMVAKKFTGMVYEPVDYIIVE
ncbi:MAG: hypothetical protein KIT80_18000 [Chitinophagaceae bacterium]|nr:hypothetical protein [Chitinophagaceae bacterium]MCW5928819.1 hypothetical protein [Chitinophagaceae bacterium]